MSEISLNEKIIINSAALKFIRPWSVIHNEAWQKLCLPEMVEFRVNNADGLPYFYKIE